MANRRRAPKFRRATPEVRREALIDATLRGLKRYGHAGVSVRRISAAAGVSIGLINHHFPSKAGLVAVTYETLALSLQESIRAQAENRAATPRARLSGFFRASFAPEILDPELFNVWLVFWSMVAHSPEIRAVHDRTYGKYRSILESLLGKLATSGEAPKFKLRPAAIALSAYRRQSRSDRGELPRAPSRSGCRSPACRWPGPRSKPFRTARTRRWETALPAPADSAAPVPAATAGRGR